MLLYFSLKIFNCLTTQTWHPPQFLCCFLLLPVMFKRIDISILSTVVNSSRKRTLPYSLLYLLFSLILGQGCFAACSSKFHPVTHTHSSTLYRNHAGHVIQRTEKDASETKKTQRLVKCLAETITRFCT